MADQVVTPWVVKSKNAIDYTKLTDQFGLKPITDELLDRFEKVTGTAAHPWLKRNIIYCHQDLDRVLDYIEAGKQVYLYTGRGPSNDMHLGHLVPFLFTVYLQKALKCITVIEMSDMEKWFFKNDLTIEDTQKYMMENIKDIVACGFDPEKTFIFSNFEYGGKMHHVCAKLMKIININQFNNIYGFDKDSLLGQVYWPIEQIAPAYPEAFPHLFGNDKDPLCIVTMSVDQSPYFRCSRDYAEKLGFQKPAMICGKFLPGLEGENTKMSSTEGVNATLFLNSTPEEIKTKVIKYAFSGGKDTLAEHRLHGGDVTVDMSFRYLTFFEFDDEKLENINKLYSTGKMLTSELKNILIEKLKDVLKKHQEERSKVTDEVIKDFMSLKQLKK